MRKLNDELDVILVTVEDVFGVKIPIKARVRGSTAQQDARRINCLIARRFTKRTLQQIGKKINRDHVCVKNNIEKAEQYLQWEKPLNQMLNECLSRLPKAIQEYKEKTIEELKSDRKLLIRINKEKIKELEKLEAI